MEPIIIKGHDNEEIIIDGTIDLININWKKYKENI